MIEVYHQDEVDSAIACLAQSFQLFWYEKCRLNACEGSPNSDTID